MGMPLAGKVIKINGDYWCVEDNGETQDKQRCAPCDHGDSQAQGWQTTRKDQSWQDLEVEAEETWE